MRQVLVSTRGAILKACCRELFGDKSAGMPQGVFHVQQAKLRELQTERPSWEF